jgi:hypothetical protein
LKSTAIFLGLTAVVALAACDKREAILQGERENIRSVLTDEAAAATDEVPKNRALPLSLPATRANADWPQAIATPATRTAHPALGADQQRIWSVNIGSGDGRRTRITADPVVAGGRIFTLDSQARVTAVSTAGEVVWTTDLTPAHDRSSDASGGGLAYGDGKIFITSGFGMLTALDPATGAQIWQQDLDATSTGAPTVRDGLVYLVAGDEIAWAVNADTGRIEWRLDATPDINNVLGGPAPAVTDKYAVFAFGAGELQGAFRKGGLRLWDAQVAGTRDGYSSALVDDITGAPVVDGETIYVGNHSGRTVALNIANGERLWTANEGPLDRIWPAGESLFKPAVLHQEPSPPSDTDFCPPWPGDCGRAVDRGLVGRKAALFRPGERRLAPHGGPARRGHLEPGGRRTHALCCVQEGAIARFPLTRRCCNRAA